MEQNKKKAILKFTKFGGRAYMDEHLCLKTVFSSPVRSMCHTCGIVRHLSMSYVVCRLCLTKLPEIINKSTFGANVNHVPGLCLLGIGCNLYINHLKIMAQKPYFHIFDIFFSETASRMTLHIMPEDSLNLGHHNL